MLVNCWELNLFLVLKKIPVLIVSMLPKEVHASYSFPLFKFAVAVAVAGALLRRWTTTATATTTTTTRACVLLLLLLVCFSLNWAWLRFKNESVSDFLTFSDFLCVVVLRTFEDLWGPLRTFEAKTHPHGNDIIAIINGLTLIIVVEEPSAHQALYKGQNINQSRRNVQKIQHNTLIGYAIIPAIH